MAEAKVAASSENTVEERKLYARAIEAAREIDWAEGEAIAFIAEGRSFMVSKEYSEAEKSLYKANAACSRGICEDSTKRSINENIFNLKEKIRE